MKTTASRRSVHIAAIACGSLALGATLVLASEVPMINGTLAKPIRVHLTFDDGPHPVNTPRLLDILNTAGVKATFFMVGNNVRRYPDIVRRVEREGHTIGNHTDTHPVLTKLTRPDVEREVDACEASLEQVLGHRTSYFRPPYGAHNAMVREVLFDRGFTDDVTWNVDSEDWKSNDHRIIIPKVLHDVQVARRGIILLHDIHAETVASVPAIIDELRGAGFSLVPRIDLLTEDHIAAVATTTVALAPGLPASVVIGSHLLATPSATAANVAELIPGETVTVLALFDAWVELQTADGKTGFVLTPNVTPIVPHVALKLGASGPRVEKLQAALDAHGANLGVDGNFGPRTDAAVRAFQTQAGLLSDGIVGAHTRAALGLTD